MKKRYGGECGFCRPPLRLVESTTYGVMGWRAGVVERQEPNFLTKVLCLRKVMVCESLCHGTAGGAA